MNDKAISTNQVIDYLLGLEPDNVIEITRVFNDLKKISSALIEKIEAINGERRIKQLQTEIEKLKTKNKTLTLQVDILSSSNKDFQQLEVKKKALLEQKQNIENIDLQKEEIEKLKDLVDKYDIPSLEKELYKIKNDFGADYTKLQIIFKNIEEINTHLHSKYLSELKKISEKISQNNDSIERESDALNRSVELKKIKIQRLIEIFNEQLSDSLNQYNNTIKHMKGIKGKLNEINENHEKNVGAFETHFSQNKEIWGVLGKEHNIDKYMNDLIGDIEKRLSDFDEAIRKALEKNEHIKVI